LFDIEVGSENGFPDPYEAKEPVTAISLTFLNGATFVWGCGDYQTKGEEKYTKCKDEYHLLKFFLKFWVDNYPDVQSGWNTKFFDIPYLVNRMRKVLGEDETKKLSPWNMISEREAFVMNKRLKVYDLVGIGDLDYLELYKWYSPNGKSQESYRLDHIANFELGEKKIDYSEYENLHQLYKLNYQKFIEYNIRDVNLLIKMEDKLRLIELALTLAYDTKTNYNDVFAQTRMWDALTYNHLMQKSIVVPPRIIKEKDAAFEGAFVKDPQVGMHEWVASFDLNSLYPHLLMQYNISPETLIEPENYTHTLRNIISEGVDVEKLLNKEVDTSALFDATLTPNGQFFRTDFQGFLPKMMEEMYEDRKKFKKMMLAAKQEKENEKDPVKKIEIEKKVARYNNLQLAKKVSLNSAYGALGSQYFRFYDLRMALAVTTAGQLSIRWIEKKINEYMNKILSSENVDYVIASDTDSIYLRLNELVLKVYGVDKVVSMPKQKVIEFMDRVCETKLQPYIDKSFKELSDYVNAFDQKMQMKREGLADKGIWTAKKRYIMHVYNNEGVQYEEPDMKVMGLEMVKSSTPASVREKMKDCLDIIMKKTETDMHNFIANFREEFKKLPVEEISFPRGVNGLAEYADKVSLHKKGTPFHVRGALLYNHYLKEKGLDKKYPYIKDGEKIKFTYLKQPNPFKDYVVSFSNRLPVEFELQNYIDYETQFEKTFLDPINIVLDCIGWTTEKTNSLFD
jgi:DNA polymerase elongation subunit (family B)